MSTPLYGWHHSMGLGGYDAWKTREPEYYDDDRYCPDEDERESELEAQASGELPELDIIDLQERCGDFDAKPEAPRCPICQRFTPCPKHPEESK